MHRLSFFDFRPSPRLSTRLVAFLGGLSFVLATATANAAIILSASYASLGDGLWRTTLKFNASEGVVAGFAGLYPGSVGFKGNLVQQLGVDVLSTPTTDLNVLIDESRDTQFLFSGAEVNAAVHPFETATSIGGAFAFIPSVRSDNFDLVQIVSHRTSLINFHFTVSEAIGDTTFPTTFYGRIGSPEPSSLVLVLWSCAAMSISRTRK